MEKRSLRWQTFFIVFVSLCAICLFVWYSATISQPDVRFDSEKVYELTQPWAVTVNGENRGLVSLPGEVDAKAGDTVVLKTILPVEDTVCNSIMFHSFHQTVKIFVDGELIHSYGDDQVTPIKMSPGGPWQYTRLPSDWAEKEITIELSGYYDEYSGTLGSVYLGTKAGLVFMVIKNSLSTFVLLIPIFILGLAMFLTSFFFTKGPAKKKLRYLGLFTAVVCLWIILESWVTQLFTGQIILCMNLIFILFSVIPMLMQAYFLTYELFSKASYMRALFYVNVAAFFAIHIACLTGLADYIATVPLVHVELIASVLGVAYALIREKVQKRKLSSDIKSLVLAIMVLTAFGVADIVRFYLPSTSKATSFAQIGLCFFIIILGVSAIRQESRSMTERMEKAFFIKLAYTDVLTELPNRTSFEEKVASYRSAGEERPLIVMMADMDNLKSINDNFGHSVGDNAIILLAEKLQRHFAGVCDCYRIGGDEFCVISEKLSAGEFEERVRALRDEIALNNIGDRAINVSCGFVECSSRDIDKALSEADRKMYAAKAEAKGI